MNIQKSNSMSRLHQLLSSIDLLQESTSNLHYTLIKEAKIASHSNETSLCSPLPLFTDSEIYKRGRIRIVSNGQREFKSQEAADFALYRKITSPNSSVSGTHMSRSELQSPAAKRVMAKFRRQFGAQITNRKKPTIKLELDLPLVQPRIQRRWRRQVNSYIATYSKIRYLHTNPTAFSLPASPSRSPGIDPGKRVTFRHLTQTVETIPNILNLRQEILHAKSEMLEQRQRLGFGQRKDIERMKIRPR